MHQWFYMVGVVFCCVCALLWKEWRERKKFAGLPCFPYIPFIGDILHLNGDGRVLFQLVKKVKHICERSASPFIFWLGHYSIVVTQDVDDIKTITNSFIEKPYLYNFMKIWLGDGLVTASGQIWKQNIKKLAGTLTSSVVNGYLGVFNTQAYKLVDKLKTKVDKEPFDIIETFLAFTTLETICQTAFGVQNISEDIVIREYYEAFNICLNLVIKRAMNIFLHPDCIYQYSNSYKKMNKYVAVIHDVSKKVLQKRKLECAQAKNNFDEDRLSDTDAPRFKSILDMLLDLGETDPSFTEKQIKSEVDTFILGGQESTAATISNVLLMLGCNPTVQDELYAELKTIFGDSRRPVVKEDLAQMKYCEAVINETLRMLPPFPGTLRYADRDLKLKKYTIPKGSLCGINLYGVGMSEKIWGSDANMFRPERWLGDQTLQNTAGGYAFNIGRRSCIGKRYAMVLMKTIVAHCVRDFEFISNTDELELKIDIVLRPISGHLIKLRLRDTKEVGNVE